jgi:hypothetical protein
MVLSFLGGRIYKKVLSDLSLDEISEISWSKGFQKKFENSVDTIRESFC